MKNNLESEVLGELIVSGCNSAEIPLLNRKEPKLIRVFFREDTTSVPCNIPQCDELEYHLTYKHGYYYLHIKWDVSSTRDIAWIVRY